MLHRLHRLTVAVASTILVLLAAGCTGGDGEDKRPGRPPIVRGLADYHNHQFASLGFAGKLHSHDADPAAICKLPPLYDGNSFRVQDMVRAGLLAESTRQAARGQCYPTSDNLAGQQVDEASLQRAFQYGLRLMVVHAVNNEFLCFAAIEPKGDCRDYDAIQRQVAAAYALEAKLDQQAGGEGKGWYQIVRSPDEARQTISDGKLAVVLGIEASNAFDCGVQPRGEILGVPGLLPLRFKEPTFQTGICPDYGIRNFTTHLALARMEKYWEMGVRHYFPIHVFDSTIGGAGLFQPLLHADTNPSGMKPGNTIFDRLPAIESTIRGVRPPFSSQQCNRMDFDGGRCNPKGLSNAGKVLIEHMASYGAVIDVDHMSLQAKLDTFTTLGAQYSLVSSHSGVHEINHGAKRNEIQVGQPELDHMASWDGAFAPVLRPATHLDEMDAFPPNSSPGHTCAGTTESFASTYRLLSERLRSAENKITDFYQPEPKFIGLGFGSDFNGLAGWPAARYYGQDVVAVAGPAFKLGIIGPSDGTPHPCLGGRDDGVARVTAKVTYPITSPMTGMEFGKSTLPWSGRQEPYDISTDGFAHIGMLPDFVQELKVLGLTDADLEPLWNGAEAYLRMWGHTDGYGRNGGYGTEAGQGIRDDCRTARAKLLSPTESPDAASIAVWKDAVSTLESLHCHGTS